MRTCGSGARSGTFPDSVVALSVRLPAAACTPSSAAILPTLDAGKESWVRAMKVVRVNEEPGLPRSVSPTRASPFSSSSSALRSESRGPPPATAGLDVQRARHRHVGADAGQRLEHRPLGAVEPRRQRGHGHRHADADAEAQGGQQRPALAPAQLAEDVLR